MSWFYKNTGTLTSPEFTFIEGEHLDLTTYGIESPFPTFGDLDGDKDAI